jgi:hypothetical protein
MSRGTVVREALRAMTTASPARRAAAPHIGRTVEAPCARPAEDADDGDDLLADE